MSTAFTACPGLFYTTPAQDGILYRLRIPGGILNSEQCHTIANIADNYAGGYIDVTNRANLQIREIKQEINIQVLQSLQNLGLGSNNPAVDHIRNIMTSPTAGIDIQELIDTRPLIQAWDEYIKKHSHLGGLSPKFSVCFDGGGKLAVKNSPNDVIFIAVYENEKLREELEFLSTGKIKDDLVYFILYLCDTQPGNPAKNTGILLKPEECIPVLAALAEVYLQHTDLSIRRKPRLREVIYNLGYDNYLKQVQEYLIYSKNEETKINLIDRNYQPKSQPQQNIKDRKTYHLGIHRQKQTDLFYIGVNLPLGRLQSWQIRGLANLATKYGSSNLRLTPWQNLLITDIPQPQIREVESEITNLGLSYSAINIKSGLVSCSGNRGCAAAATDTKSHALALGEYLETHTVLDSPINIHFTGCMKSCAQHHQGDITLVGINTETQHDKMETYQMYLADDSCQKFGRQIYAKVNFTQLPQLMERILKTYQIKRLNSQESFREFANRYDILQLQQLFTVQSIAKS